MEERTISKYVQHRYPVWGEKVNFITEIESAYGEPLESGEDYIIREQIGCRKLSPTELELCCLPFFAYGFTLGDILEMDPTTYDVKGIKKKSGRYLYRIFFNCPNPRSVKIAASCKEHYRALIEWHNSKLCAVDIATPDLATAFCSYMNQLSAEGILEFEDGFVS